jgi:Ser/Thr protein kinase RdoA (MazF antagonist)
MTELSSLTKRYHTEAPCHRELNPGNVIVTGDSAFFVDWDAAGQGDTFLDLAELSVFEPPNLALREQALALYLGRAPSAEESARATLARVHALGFFATVSMYAAVHTGRPWNESTKTLPMVDLLMQMGASVEGALFDTMAMSFLDEMRREMELEAYAKAKAVLAAL